MPSRVARAAPASRSVLRVAAASLVAACVVLVGHAGGSSRAAEDAPPRKPVSVTVEGIEGEAGQNVRAALSLAGEAKRGNELPSWRVERLHARAREEILRALQPFGYYRPEVDAQLTEQEGEWKAVYRVAPGPAIEVTRVSVELEGPGRKDEELQKAVEGFPVETGEPLSHSLYEQGKRRLRDQASDRGYLDARYATSEIRLDLEAYRAEIVLALETGPRHRFGEVTFDQDFLIPELLSAYVPFEPGDPYDRSQLSELRDRLAGTPYFGGVEIRPRPERKEGLRVPIEVTLSPRPKRKWTLGLGFGTDTGPRGKAAVEVRRFGNRGHRGNLQTKLSQIESAVEATYEIPGGRRGPRVIALTTGYRDENIDDGDAQTVGVGIELTRTRGGWRQSFGLAFDLDDFNIGVDSGRSELLAPRIGFSYVRADDRIVPRRGYRVTFEIRGASEDALSNASYLQGRASGKGVISFGRSWRAIGRMEVGYTQTEEFSALPPSVRFFAGGDASVRGYDFRELGPRDESGTVLGGEALVVGSLELERRVYQGWRAAVFVDAGNAMRKIDGPLETGAGIGVRWRSPIGMIRGDLAWAISRAGTPIRFHLTVGPDL